MKNYLTKNLNYQDQKIANNYDELPLWSAPFGLLLMNNFPIGNYSKHLDIGSGTGFSLIDIAHRLGSECKSYGVDPWHSGVNKARSKIDVLGLTNIELIEAVASNLPYPDGFFDLATSNLGLIILNNHHRY